MRVSRLGPSPPPRLAYPQSKFSVIRSSGQSFVCCETAKPHLSVNASAGGINVDDNGSATNEIHHLS
jgi:hypothetical protein